MPPPLATLRTAINQTRRPEILFVVRDKLLELLQPEESPEQMPDLDGSAMDLSDAEGLSRSEKLMQAVSRNLLQSLTQVKDILKFNLAFACAVRVSLPPV